MDFTHTRISATRPLTSYSKIQRLVGAVIRNSRLQRRRGEYLNVGCGSNVAPGFVNLDYLWHPGVFCWDLSRGLPFEDSSMRGIYSEHCLEHLEPELAMRTLREFRRVLSPGGTARIVVPDGELYIRRYADGGEIPHPGRTRIAAVNAVFNGHGHRFIYDFETLNLDLKAAGFQAVERKAFREGTSVLLLDSQHREPGSLYVEAY